MKLDIVKLAREAGLTCYGGSQSSSGHHSWHAYTPHLQRFADLIRKNTLEDAADIADSMVRSPAYKVAEKIREVI